MTVNTAAYFILLALGSHLWWFEYACPMGSGSVRKCGLGAGMALLEEVHRCGDWALKLPPVNLIEEPIYLQCEVLAFCLPIHP